MRPYWDEWYLGMAKYVSTRSKDPRKKVGAVVTEGRHVRGLGYNGFPSGIDDTPARLADQQIKLQVTLHAEVNALAAAKGVGDTIYIYPCLPCAQCLSFIIQSGIKRVITWAGAEVKQGSTKWNPELVLSLAEEAGIDVLFVEVLDD